MGSKLTAKLQNISAKPHPYGNRIDLTWENPDPDLFPGVRVIRREKTYPVSPDDGHLVAEPNAFLFNTNTSVTSDLDNKVVSFDLRQMFSNIGTLLSNDAAVKIEDPSKKWLITDGEREYVLKNDNGTVSVYKKGIDSASDRNLKSETVYYYALFPFKNDPPEYVIDSSHRTAAMATGPYDMAGQMYDLLPRIYHRYDTTLSDLVSGNDKQKGELRRLLDIPGTQLDQLYSFAKAMLDVYDIDKVDGRILRLLAQWIGWKTDFRNEISLQRNEIRNAPFLYKTIGLIPNVEAAVKRISGWESRTKEFVHNVFLSNSPQRLNLWAKEKNSSGEWPDAAEQLLSLDFAYDGRPACAYEAGRTWLFYHSYRKRLWKDDHTSRGVCNIWYKVCNDSGWSPGKPLDDHWSPSEPLNDRLSIDKHPAATFHDGTLWVFWSVYDDEAGAWHIEYRTWDNRGSPGGWSGVMSDLSPFGNSSAERKMPLAVDADGVLWLFWMEKTDQQWQMKYNKYKNGQWQAPTAAQPLIGEMVEDPFVAYYSSGAMKRIYLFWARKEQTEIHRSIVYTSIDSNLDAWDVTIPLGKPQNGDFDDREPSAVVKDDGLDLYWSSSREGNWSVWRNLLKPSTNSWGAAEQVTFGPYSQRNPLPVLANGRTTLVYRSNRSISYGSQIYKATKTTDFRYAGSTTVDVDNLAKNKLHGFFEDFQTYTYDTRKKDNNWYARDTAGMYIKVGTGDPALISRNRGMIKQLLTEIMPIQVRAVFIIESIYEEERYDFLAPDKFVDEIIWGRELYSGVKGAWEDIIADWAWLHSCDCVTKKYLNEHSVNFDVPPGTPIETKYRTWHTGLNRIIEEE
jgi:hypothetical protein